MRHVVTGLLLAAVIGGAGLDAFAQATGDVVRIKLPAWDANFHPGPGADLARHHCVTCHAADYVYTQPPLTRAQWTAEVTKMIKAFGAPIPDADTAPLVDYLMTQNGKS
jgi:mono/diheme cytochrome c family protein